MKISAIVSMLLISIIMLLSLLIITACEQQRTTISTADGDDALFDASSRASKPAKPQKPTGIKADGVQPAPSGRSETYTSYGVRNGGRQAWRIPKKGPAYGPQLKVVFSNGYTVLVRDTSHNFRQSNGFVFKPGIGPNGTGNANTGTAHGGIYLHAPYGNRSSRVTLTGSR